LSTTPEIVPPQEDILSLVRTLWSRGLGSRSHLRRLIESGRVRVNGTIVRRPGFSVRPDSDVIELTGRRLPAAAPHLYLALHKPRGVISNRRGPGEVTVFDILPPLPRWVFPVGRLDKDTSGLILLTSDGLWAERVAHPDFAVIREYIAELEEPVHMGALQSLRKGIPLGPDIISRPAEVDLLGELRLRLRIREGKRHQVRKMVRAAGGKLTSLCRTAIGSVHLGGLNKRELRDLTHEERNTFLSATRNGVILPINPNR